MSTTERDKVTSELPREVLCLHEMFLHPPEIRYTEEGEEADSTWTDTSDVLAVIASSRSYVTSRFKEIRENPLKNLQESSLNSMFDKLEDIVTHKGSRQAFGLSVIQLLNAIDGIVRFTCIAATHEVEALHSSAFKVATKEGKFQFTSGDWKQTFVASKGRRVSDNKGLYDKFDDIRKDFLDKGKKLNNGQIIKEYEKQTGRHLPFNQRSKIVVSYGAMIRRRTGKASEEK